MSNKDNNCKSSDQAHIEIAGLLRKAEIARNAHYMIASSKDRVERYIHAVVLVGDMTSTGIEMCTIYFRKHRNAKEGWSTHSK